MVRRLGRDPLLVICLLVCSPGMTGSATTTAATVTSAIADPRRPAEQVKLDANRKPAATLAFAGVKAGDQLADVMAGNGYFTRLLSDVVGPSGHVYAYIPTEQIAHCAPDEYAGTQAISRDASYANVTLLTGSLTAFVMPEKLDLIWMSQSYHDLHDSFLGPANVPALNKAIFDALKPGGAFLVIDHVAEPGSGLRDTETLHRIDPEAMKSEIESVGFVLESQSSVLLNPNDDHRRAIFDSGIRGKTDQVMFRFRKPWRSLSP
jgi:predicted methyltransferase